MEGSTVLATISGSLIRMGMHNRVSAWQDERSSGVTGLERGTNGKSLRRWDVHLAHEVNTHNQETRLLKRT